jgi:ribonuclease HII
MTQPWLIPMAEGPLALERELWRSGVRLMAGVDEAGRGALAGPVVAAAVIVPPRVEALLSRVRDSKKLSPGQREDLMPLIRECALAVGTGVVGPEEIDRVNILNASLEAMRIAIEALDPCPRLCLIDGNCRVPHPLPQRLIVKGDDRVFSIAAASIVAKVTRDRLMDELDARYPQYGFSRNKGYGTADHLRALGDFGPSAVHRRSFSLRAPSGA